MEVTKKNLNNSKVVKITLGLELNPDTQEVGGMVELDIENQSKFVEAVNNCLDEGKANIITDIQYVSYTDSSGLWSLFEGHKKASQKGGKLILLNPTKDVKRILDITKMSSKIAILNNEQEAIASFNEE